MEKNQERGDAGYGVLPLAEPFWKTDPPKAVVELKGGDDMSQIGCLQGLLAVCRFCLRHQVAVRQAKNWLSCPGTSPSSKTLPLPP